MPTKNEVLDLLQTVEDPELMMGIVDLGLVYEVEVRDEEVYVEFPLTYPGCPAGDMIQNQIVEKVEQGTGMAVQAELVWNPPWAPEFMSDEAKVALGYPV